MAVSTTARKKVYISNGTYPQVFAVPFDFKDTDEILLYEFDTTTPGTPPVKKTQNVHFVVQAPPTSTVATTGGYTPASGKEMHIVRSTGKDQAITFPASGAFPSASAEEGLDRAALLVQDAIGTSIQSPYPMLNDTVTLGLTTSDQAIYTSQAIVAPAGMSGSLVEITGFIYSQWSVAPSATESIIVTPFNGPLGTVLDPAVTSGLRVFPVTQAVVYTPMSISWPAIRVDDGDIITIGARRTSSTGTVNVAPSFGGFNLRLIDSY